MAVFSNTPRPGYIYDSTDAVWYPIGTGTHSHSEIASTIIDAKGDLIVGSAADTPIRKAVGTDGQMLYADSTVTGGIKWADAPASGGMTLLSTTTLSGTSVTLSSIPSTYKQLYLTIIGASSNNDGSELYLQFNSDTGSNYTQTSPSNNLSGSFGATEIVVLSGIDTTAKTNQANITIPNYTNTNTWKFCTFESLTPSYVTPASEYYAKYAWGLYKSTSAISSITLSMYGTMNTGTAYLYGVN